MCCWITRDPTFGDQPLLCPCLLSLPFNIKVYSNDERCPQVTDVLTEASAREGRSTGSKSIVASFTGGTRTGQSLLLLSFSCCAVPLARKSCNSLRCEPLTAGLSLPFEHEPVGINVSPYVSCLQLFFLLAAAWVDPGRSALQSAEQWRKGRYGRMHQVEKCHF